MGWGMGQKVCKGKKVEGSFMSDIEYRVLYQDHEEPLENLKLMCTKIILELKGYSHKQAKVWL